MNVQHISSRPQARGSSDSIQLRPSAQELTVDAGLLVLGHLREEVGLGSWIDDHTAELNGWCRSSLVVEG